MQAHSTIRKTARYASDVSLYTKLTIICIVCIFIFSFAVQLLYTNQRNQGRDIRTSADYFSTQLFMTRTSVIFMYLDNLSGKMAPDKLFVSLVKEQVLIDQYHEYIKEHSIDKHAYQLFLENEQVYAIIMNLMQLFSNRMHTISESEILLFTTYTNTYASALTQFKGVYTQILAANNNLSVLYSVGELFAELGLLAFLFFFVISGALRRFAEATKKAEELQAALLNTKSERDTIIRSRNDAVTIPMDVACFDKGKYLVANRGTTQNVYYNEERKIFVCDCRIYLQVRSCYHINRAKQLHQRIYRENVRENVI